MLKKAVEVLQLLNTWGKRIELENTTAHQKAPEKSKDETCWEIKALKNRCVFRGIEKKHTIGPDKMYAKKRSKKTLSLHARLIRRHIALLAN